MKEAIFNTRKRRTRRSRIPFFEMMASIIILGGLLTVCVWFLNQKDRFDPSQRTISLESWNSNAPIVELYKPASQKWVEPGATSVSPVENLDIFPTAILEGGWRVNSAVKAFDENTLFEKVNGEADKFLQKGFRTLWFIRLNEPKSNDEIAIELFDQTDLKGSLGVFDEYLSAEASPLSSNGVVYIANPGSAIGRKGRFFFRIIGNSDSRTVTEKTVQITKSMADLPEESGEIPFEYRFLVSKMGLQPEWISFQSSNVFQFGFARDFWFGVPEQVKTGRVFLHKANTQADAIKLFDRLVQEQGYDYETVKKSQTLAVLRHNFLNTWFIVSIEGPLIYGIEKIENSETAQYLLGQISDRLFDEE